LVLSHCWIDLLSIIMAVATPIFHHGRLACPFRERLSVSELVSSPSLTRDYEPFELWV
jgi:hypothetical protein